uniref:Uncharacterized protein n=1 Tax=Glossina brevipalpis TaxID=37001 RepID=A0A1A9WRD9_9MUSC
MIMKKFSTSGLMTLKYVALLCILLSVAITTSETKRLSSGNRKSSGGGYSTHRQPSTSVTKPSYSGNSHADQAKLSYPNYNSQPNRPANAPSQNSPPIGWNVNNQQGHAGPPPAYSASNVAGGAKTNVYEQPPVYQKPNYAAPPPNYNQATGNHFGAGANSYAPHNIPPGATYHSSGTIPAGATYYPAGSHMPSGGYPAGGHSYYGGAMPAGGSYYPAGGAMPAGATFIPAGSSLPAGATYYSSPPQQSSSGPGFGTGLVAGALGGALLGHALTPTQTRVVEHAPASSDGNSGGDRIIIINNGQPVNATDVNGATVINTAGQPAAATPPVNPENPAPLAPMAPVAPGEPVSPPAPGLEQNMTAAPAEQPAPGGIICVPMRINETDPNDATKMIEVEKIACYPAPPPPLQTAPVDGNVTNPVMPPVEGSAPLAPLQQSPTQATLIAEQSNVQTASKGGNFQQNLLSLIATSFLSCVIAYIIN